MPECLATSKVKAYLSFVVSMNEKANTLHGTAQ